MAGSLFVISAPSGSGKSSLIQRLLRRNNCPRLDYSVSFTTRSPRPGEEDGRDYNFIDHATFQEMIQNKGFLEWAQVFDNFYGTGREWVNQRLQADRDILVDVDVVGAKNLKLSLPSAIMLFMVPPNRLELTNRLTKRNTETPEEVARRLAKSNWEIEQRFFFDYLVINDNLEEAVLEVENIINRQNGHLVVDREAFWPTFFQENQ
ncbi:MAG: guanylate kinase [Deltaproteobacteria bacterium]|jgi:guanylate kinase|nr:guanylate kinase [Deltaproteobacteria bacterium]